MSKYILIIFILFTSCASKKVSSVFISYKVNIVHQIDGYINPNKLTVMSNDDFMYLKLETNERVTLFTIRDKKKSKLSIYLKYKDIEAKITDLDGWQSTTTSLFKLKSSSNDNVSINEKEYKAIKYVQMYHSDTVAEIVALKDYKTVYPLLDESLKQIHEIPVSIRINTQKKVHFEAIELTFDSYQAYDNVSAFKPYTLSEAYQEIIKLNPDIKIKFNNLFYLFNP